MECVYETHPAADAAANTSAQTAQPQNVVSNDKTTDAATSVSEENTNTGTPVEDLIIIRKDHDDWVGDVYARSNEALYSLLARSLSAYQRMVGKPAHIKAFHAECDRVGLKFKKTTGVLQRIVSYVFLGAGRRRTSAYTCVLDVANAQKIDPGQLHVWIAREGGVEEIRARKAKGLTAKQKLDANVAIATSAVAAATPITVIHDAKVDLFEAETTFDAALARTTSDGSLEVIGYVTDSSVIKAVLAAYGEKVTVEAASDARVSAADENAQILSAAVAA